MTPDSVPPALPEWSKREDVPTPPLRTPRAETASRRTTTLGETGPSHALGALRTGASAAADEWFLGSGRTVPDEVPYTEPRGPSLAFLPPVYDEASGPLRLYAPDLPPNPAGETEPVPLVAEECHPLADWRFEIETARQRAQEAEEHGLWSVHAVVERPGPGPWMLADEVGNDAPASDDTDASAAWLASARQSPLRVYESGAHRIKRPLRELERGSARARWLWAAAIACSAAGVATWLHERVSQGGPAGEESALPAPVASAAQAAGGASAEGAPPESDAAAMAALDEARLVPSAGDEVLPDEAEPLAPVLEAVSATANAGSDATPPAESKAGTLAEWGRLTLPLAAGRVVRTFTLHHPPRVVVDLEGADIAGPHEEPIGDKGIARMRIGRPDPQHVRVVVELQGERKPTNPSAWKRSDSLAIAWR